VALRGIEPLENKLADEFPNDAWGLPTVCGEAEADTLASFELITAPAFAQLVGDEKQPFTDGFGYLLSRPSCIAGSTEIENHSAFSLNLCKGNDL
jgi:hypothetical protein